MSSVANAVKYPEVSGDFVVEDGVVFTGKHLLIDLWGASHLDDIDYIRTTLENIVNECNATLLHIHLHQFTENGGVSGVLGFKQTRRAGPVTGFFHKLWPTFHENERFSQKVSMRYRQKAVPLGKINDFFTFIQS